MNNAVLRPETIDQMLTPHVRATKREREEQDKLDEYISWGFGWGIQPGEGENGFWHWGDNGDLRAYTVFYRERKEGLIFLANSENLFTIAEELVSLVLDDPQYAFNWLRYKRHDDPERAAVMTVEKAFLEEGNSAGLSKLEEVKDQYPKAFETEDLSDIARYLLGRDKKDEAGAIFKWIIDSDAESVVAWTGLGRLYLETGRNKESLECLQRILELDPKNSLARISVPWIKELIEIEENPVSVAEELLGKYAGDYGPRHVRLKEGSLYYQRDGRPEYRLVPLKEDTFALEGYGVFRLRFVMDEKGDVIKVVGIYLGGSTDESERNK